MSHHVILWPFKKVIDWLKSYFQSKQLKELIALQQKQLLLDSVPEVDVSIRLIRNPDPPRRSDIPIVDVIVKNYGGKTKLTKGSFRMSLSDNPGYEEKKNLADLDMPKGKEEKFFFLLIRQFFDQVMSGNSILKFEYELHFYGPNEQPQECKKTYEYNPQEESFISQ